MDIPGGCNTNKEEVIQRENITQKCRIKFFHLQFHVQENELRIYLIKNYL